MTIIGFDDFKCDFTILVNACSNFLNYDLSDEEIIYISGLIPRTIEIDKFYKIEENREKLTYLVDLIEYYIQNKNIESYVLQYIGDYCLLLCSLFEKNLNRIRRSDFRNFYIEGGKSSYKNLASIKHEKMFYDLSQHFLECCKLLKISLETYNQGGKRNAKI